MKWRCLLESSCELDDRMLVWPDADGTSPAAWLRAKSPKLLPSKRVAKMTEHLQNFRNDQIATTTVTPPAGDRSKGMYRSQKEILRRVSPWPRKRVLLLLFPPQWGNKRRERSLRKPRCWERLELGVSLPSEHLRRDSGPSFVPGWVEEEVSRES